MKTFAVVDVPQRSPEWFQARCGRLTSSNVADIYKAGKGSAESVGKRDLRMRLALERLTMQAHDDGDSWTTREMQRGIEKEPDARLAYEAARGVIVQECGFLSHTELMAGASLDGYVGDFEGVTEFKCPKSATHWATYKAQAVPSDYMPQIAHQLWLTGAAWADFVSFDDRFPADKQLVIVRVSRESVDLKAHDKAVRAFLIEIENAILEMRTVSNPSEVLAEAAGLR